jgi:hypothetical protein
MTSPSRDRPPAPGWWTAALVLLAVAIGIYLFAPTEADPDLWGHVRFGLDTLDTGRIVRPDIYAYTSGDVPWINHEWLSEAIMAIAYRFAGAPGLIAIKLALGLTLAALLVRHLRRVGLLPAFLITAYAIAVMLPGFRSLRPQAFTYLLFLGVLLLIHRADRGQPRTLWLAPPLFAIWVNLHGGFVAGLGVLAASALFRRQHRRAGAGGRDGGGSARQFGAGRDRWLPVVAAALATLLNPYGVGLWTFLARTLGPRPDIAEWQAVSLTTMEGAAYLAVLAFGAIGVAALVRSRQWLAVILFAGGATLPFLARRHLPLFVLMTIVVCAEHSAAAIAAFVRRRAQGDVSSSPTSSPASSPAPDRFRPIVATMLVIQAVVLLAIAVPRLVRISVTAADYPIAATAWLARSGVAAHLAVDFDWGEYVIWHVGPRVQVSVDGRRETVYSDAVYELNQRFIAGVDGWDRLLTERPSDLVLVGLHTGACDRLMQRADWTLLLRDETSALFGRPDSPSTRALRATPIPAIEPDRAVAFP